MASSEYESINSKFLSKIKDPELAMLAEKQAKELMQEWLDAVASDPAIRKIFTYIDFDEDMEEVNFTMRRSIDENFDQRYVENLLATGMVVEWTRPIMNNKMLLNQFFGGKEQNFYSQSNHLNSVRQLFEKSESELSKMTAKHGYSEFMINGGIS